VRCEETVKDGVGLGWEIVSVAVLDAVRGDDRDAVRVRNTKEGLALPVRTPVFVTVPETGGSDCVGDRVGTPVFVGVRETGGSDCVGDRVGTPVLVGVRETGGSDCVWHRVRTTK